MTDRQKAVLKALVMAAGLAGAGLLLRAMGAAPGTEWADQYLLGKGASGFALFLLVGGALTAVGAPRQAVAFMGGYAYGAVLGSLLAVAATLLGAAASFYWARLVARGWAERRLAGGFGRRLRPVRDALAESPFGATLALRLLPLGNNLALNLLAGMAGIGAGPYLAASALGYLPQTLVFAFLGKGVRVDGVWQLAMAAGLFVVSVGIGFWLLRRARAARAMEG